MPLSIQERRTEPRFHVAGRVNLLWPAGQCDAETVDVSLNGLQVALPDGLQVMQGENIEVEVWIGDISHFLVKGVAAHQHAQHLGIEFYGMSTADFDSLSGLIALLGRDTSKRLSAA